MSPEEIEQAINKIAWGGRFVKATNNLGQTRLLAIKPISIREKNFVDFIYDSALKESLESGVLSKFELYNFLKTRGLWTSQDDDNHLIYTNEVSRLSEEISEGSGNVFALRAQLSFVKDELNKLNTKKRNLLSTSAESFAEEQRLLALVFCSTYNLKEEKEWHDWDIFLSSIDNGFINSILESISNSTSLDVKKIRAIARSHMWRFRWNAAKSIGDLFGCPIMEFTPEQQNLLYWSQVYDSVFESMDKPSDEVINDDDALDNWFESQNKKRNIKSIEETGRIGKLTLNSKMRSHGEVGIVTNPSINPNAPSREYVDGLNPEITRKMRMAEEKKIKTHGNIKEQDLRERGNHLARKMIGSKDVVLGANKFGSQRKSGGKTLPGGTL